MGRGTTSIASGVEASRSLAVTGQPRSVLVSGCRSICRSSEDSPLMADRSRCRTVYGSFVGGVCLDRDSQAKEIL